MDRWEALQTQFKAVPETTWVVVIGMLVAVTGGIANIIGLDPKDATLISGIVVVVARQAIGAIKGSYDFKAIWEVAWAGIQTGSAIVAAVIANTQAGDVTTGGIAMTAMVLIRPVITAMLAIANPVPQAERT